MGEGGWGGSCESVWQVGGVGGVSEEGRWGGEGADGVWGVGVGVGGSLRCGCRCESLNPLCGGGTRLGRRRPDPFFPCLLLLRSHPCTWVSCWAVPGVRGGGAGCACDNAPVGDVLVVAQCVASGGRWACSPRRRRSRCHRGGATSAPRTTLRATGRGRLARRRCATVRVGGGRGVRSRMRGVGLGSGGLSHGAWRRGWRGRVGWWLSGVTSPCGLRVGGAGEGGGGEGMH